MNPSGWLKSVRSFRHLCARIPRAALVLEVGSGDKPFWRSDVLCDKHWCDNTERGGSLVVDRPAVIGAIEELPFRTQAFDFVICHHLLEHVEDPAVCLEELMRVARRGSIRVPTVLAEKLLSPVYHRWFISAEAGQLVFREKSAPVFDPQIKTFMKQKLLAGKERYAAFYRSFRDDLEIQLLWDAGIPYRVHRTNGELRDHAFKQAALVSPCDPLPQNKVSLQSTWTQRAKGAALRIARRLHGAPRVDLRSVLACPICKSEVIDLGHALSCRQCRVRYPVRGAVPILLREAACPSDSARPVTLVHETRH